MPLENDEGEDLQLTGSTFLGQPSVVGGVYRTGSLAAYVQSIQVDPSGSVFVTASGSLPVHVDSTIQAVIAGQIGVNNFPATQNVSGTVTSIIGNWPSAIAVSGSQALLVWSGGAQGVSASQQLPVFNTGPVGVTASAPLPVDVNNWPAVFGVTASVQLPVFSTGPVGVTASATLPVAQQGQVGVSNFPATQNVSGTVTSIVGNWPATLGVTASAQLPVFSTGYVGVSGSATSPVWVTTTGSLPVVIAANVATQSVLVTNLLGQGVPVTSSFTKPLFTYPTSERITVMSGGVISGNGSVLVDAWPGWTEWYLLANLSGTVGGTNPTIQFYVDQVDPIDKITPVTARVSGAVMTGKGVSNFQVVDTNSDTFIVGWVVTGTTPFFSGVNISWVGRAAGSAVEGQAAVGTQAGDPPVPVAGVDDQNNIQYLHLDSAGNLHTISTVQSGVTSSLSPGWVHYGGSAGVQTAVRATTYTEQTGSAQRSLKSTSASDSANGTGAQQVKITYYDNNGNGPFFETVTLNGLTAVNTVSTTMRFIEEIAVTKVGTGGSNVGTVSLFTAPGGVGGVIGSIGVGTVVAGIGDNQTLWAHHYVGNLLTGSVVGLTCGTNGNQTGIAYLRVQNPMTSSNPENFLTDVLTTATAADSVIRTYPAGIPVLGPARVTMYVVSNGTNTNFYGSFDWEEHY